VDDRQKEGAGTATINRELAALLRMFYLGHESTAKKVLDVPHFPMLRENNTRTGFPEDRQYQNLVEGAELWLPALIECGSTVGWRHEELISLRVKQVDLDRRILRLEPGTTKNKHAKRQCLWRCCSCSRVEGKGSEDRVFTWPNGGKPVIVRDRCTKPAVPPAWARCTASNAMSKSPTRSCRNALGADAG
jgi:integrase